MTTTAEQSMTLIRTAFQAVEAGDLQAVQDIFGVDDKVTVLLHCRGTHLGAFQQFEATGRQAGYRSIGVNRLVGDKIAEEWVPADVIGLMRQITSAPTDH
ncbi:ester cyclase [Streptomyces sp. NPDC055663]